MDKEQEENRDGICLLFDVLNSGTFNIILDFNKPDENACKAFGFMLSLLERGKLYDLVLERIKEYISKNDKNVNQVLEVIFTYKDTIDNNLDLPVILPRDVFKRINPGV